jgi:hypothetical protein
VANEGKNLANLSGAWVIIVVWVHLGLRAWYLSLIPTIMRRVMFTALGSA